MIVCPSLSAQEGEDHRRYLRCIHTFSSAAFAETNTRVLRNLFSLRFSPNATRVHPPLTPRDSPTTTVTASARRHSQSSCRDTIPPPPTFLPPCVLLSFVPVLHPFVPHLRRARPGSSGRCRSAEAVRCVCVPPSSYQKQRNLGVRGSSQSCPRMANDAAEKNTRLVP